MWLYPVPDTYRHCPAQSLRSSSGKLSSSAALHGSVCNSAKGEKPGGFKKGSERLRENFVESFFVVACFYFLLLRMNWRAEERKFAEEIMTLSSRVS